MYKNISYATKMIKIVLEYLKQRRGRDQSLSSLSHPFWPHRILVWICKSAWYSVHIYAAHTPIIIPIIYTYVRICMQINRFAQSTNGIWCSSHIIHTCVNSTVARRVARVSLFIFHSTSSDLRYFLRRLVIFQTHIHVHVIISIKDKIVRLKI